MRRLIVSSSLSFLAASLCVLATLSPAGAAVSVPHIVCPEQHAPNVVSCCPGPVTGPTGTTSSPHFVPCCAPSGTCCPPTTCCAQPLCCVSPCAPGELTIAASPDPSTAGRKVVISGALMNPPASRAKVLLWRELSGQSTFRRIAHTTTDGAGHYTFRLKAGTVNADQRWYVTANGFRSPTLMQHVKALVGLAGPRTVAAGQAMLLHGHVAPSHAGQVVLLEQRAGGRWTVIARPRLGHSSSYGVMLRFIRSGTIELKAVLAGDARNDLSASRTLAVTVKP